MRRRAISACVTGALGLSLGACAQQSEEPICVTTLTREPVGIEFCHTEMPGYEWARGDDDDFDLVKKRRKATTVVRPVVPQVKQPVVIKRPASGSGTGGMGRK